MGVTYLLDTHVILWLVGEQDEVPDRVQRELDVPSVAVLVSSASAWETATKTRLGRLGLPGLVEGWSSRVTEAGFEQISVDTDDALLAGSMTWDHKDPFDRMLAAQAIRRGAVLVTVDRALLGLPTLRTLSW